MELSFHRLRMVEGVGQSFCSKALSSCALSFCKLFFSAPDSICTRPVRDHVCNYKKGGHIVNRAISRGIKSGAKRRCFYILSCKRAWRHSAVQFFDIPTSKNGPKPVCFVHFDLQMCFSLQQLQKSAPNPSVF